VFEEEMDKEEVGTRWFSTATNPAIFWLRDEILEIMRQAHCPIAALLFLSADWRVTAASVKLF